MDNEEKTMKAWKPIIVTVLLAGLLLSALVACGGTAESPAPTLAEPTQAAAAEPTQPAAAEPTQPAAAEPTQTTAAEPTQAIAAEATQAPEPTAAPADTPVSGSAEGTGLDASSLTSESSLSSYRSKTSIVTTGVKDGENVTESMEFTVEYTSDPLVEHVIMSGTNVDGTGAQGIEMYNTTDTTYMKMGDQWMSVPASEDNQIGQSLLTADDMLATTCGWEKEKDTEVNGIAVEHYTATKDRILSCSGIGLLADTSGITDAGGDLYVAKDGNYIVQMDFYYAGTNLDFSLGTADESVQEGRLEIHTEMSDVNQPFTIQIPEEATSAGALPEDIPFPDDAQEVGNMFGMITFNSPSTAQEVADYYKSEMPNNGWTETSSDELGDMFMMEYTKDARTASFMISTDSDTGQTSVMITIEEGQ
jgi:hypothetical protein